MSDRLARNAVDAGRIIYLLDTKKLVDLKFPTVMFQNNPQGLFMLSIAFGQSKYYVDSLSENTKRGLRQKIRQGGYPSLAPIGYLNDRFNKTILIDKKKAPIVLEAFNLYATGNYSMKAISQFFASNNILSVRSHKLIKVDIIKRIFTNPFYYGYFRYNNEIYQGKHKPLITKKFFDQVQTVVAKRGHVQPKSHYNFPFAGFMKCGHCDFTITGETKTKFYKGTNRTARYTYYRCTRKSKTIDCRQPFIREEVLVEQLNELIKKHSLPDEWGKEFYQRIDDEEKQITQSLLESGQAIKLTLQAIKTRLDQLLESYLDKVIDRDDYLENKNKLMGQKKNLEEQLVNLHDSQTAWLGPFRDWVKLALQAKEISGSTTDYHSKRNFLLNPGSDFRLRDKKAYFPSRKPWAALGAAATIRKLVGVYEKIRTFFKN
ncbi:MAG: recombinase family protein [Patescibacteria group bacterium]|nr:recombinase family protein [Patescibacteria group bacterium]